MWWAGKPSAGGELERLRGEATRYGTVQTLLKRGLLRGNLVPLRKMAQARPWRVDCLGLFAPKDFDPLEGEDHSDLTGGPSHGEEAAVPGARWASE